MTITQANYESGFPIGVDVFLDGKPAIIELTKKSFLDLGVARLEDENGNYYPITYNLLADHAQGRGALNLKGFTHEPVVVCLARRYWKAVNSEDFKPGPVLIPTLEEALAELRDPNSWTEGI